MLLVGCVLFVVCSLWFVVGGVWLCGVVRVRFVWLLFVMCCCLLLFGVVVRRCLSLSISFCYC